MNKELIINSSSNEVIIALLEDKLLVELHREKHDSQHAVGDVYLGRIRKVMPGLNAAFVDIGSEKDAFLHYLDMGPQIKTLQKFTEHAVAEHPKAKDISPWELPEDLDKSERLVSFLKPNQSLVVQISKKPSTPKVLVCVANSRLRDAIWF